MDKIKKEKKILFSTGGNGGLSTKISIPINIARDMGFSENDRIAKLEYDSDVKILKITKKIVKNAKNLNIIKPHACAFKLFPTKNEIHKGNINFYKDGGNEDV